MLRVTVTSAAGVIQRPVIPVKIWMITRHFHPENFGINRIAADLVRRGHGVSA